MSLVLHGYRYSVYTRIARLVLEEKGVAYELVEVNPFDPDMPRAYLALHPFRRVPTFVHDGFTLYETGAIGRYIDRAFAGPSLQPRNTQALARMDQIIGVVDSYAYWPLVRQVFVHGFFRRRTGGETDSVELDRGLATTAKVLAALEVLATEEVFLTGPTLSLADLHLGAMVAYLAATPAGAALLGQHRRLADWWARLERRPSFAATDPFLPVTEV